MTCTFIYSNNLLFLCRVICGILKNKEVEVEKKNVFWEITAGLSTFATKVTR